MRVVRLLRWGTVIAGCAIGVLACSESSTAPAAPGALARLERADAPLLDAWGSGSGSEAEGSFSYTLDPLQGYTVHFGDHRLRLPAGVICEPGRTDYGVGHWDRPCVLATRPIVFTVTYKTVDGRAQMRVQPDVRFALTSDPTRWVVLSMKQQGRLDVTKLYNILWLHQGDWIDESRTDASLLPWTDYVNGTVARRLKHFSGYSVTAGRSGGDDGTEGDAGY